MSDRACFYGCGATADLRPYGPGGEFVCFACATTPERNDETAGRFLSLLDANQAIAPVVVIGTEEGPQPFDMGESRQ